MFGYDCYRSQMFGFECYRNKVDRTRRGHTVLYSRKKKETLQKLMGSKCNVTACPAIEFDLDVSEESVNLF